jgi:acetyltransferase
MLGAAKNWIANRWPWWLAAPRFNRRMSRPADLPHGWERTFRLDDGVACVIRPLRPDDEALYPAFLAGVTSEDLRLRFFVRVKEFSHDQIAAFTHMDHANAMAFAAIDQRTECLLGVARLHRLPDRASAEFAILVRSDTKGHGVGWNLMQILIEYARRVGIAAVVGDVLPENADMLRMCAELGFNTAAHPADSNLRSVRLALSSR